MGRFRTLLLDLDDTVYPAGTGLWEAIGERINRFMVEAVGIEPARAASLRQQYFERYGTSLHGLRIHYGIDPFAYLAYVHDIPLETYVGPDPSLRRMLTRLSVPPVIFTNADSAHARRVLRVLGVDDLIGQIIDIVALEWVNKPQPEAYRRAMALCGVDQAAAYLVVDDQPRNLFPAAALGMGTVLVGSSARMDGIDACVASASDLLEAYPELKSQAPSRP
ncbi:MAG TPA: pyrimidine 5'-nucleotidase [Anaerolineales bacterium]|nr:pyrimidine 5'-nucleotidase [Anaerolineales bacterium]